LSNELDTVTGDTSKFRAGTMTSRNLVTEGAKRLTLEGPGAEIQGRPGQRLS